MLLALLGYWFCLWLIWCYIVDIIIFKLEYPEKLYIYNKKDNIQMGWLWGWYRFRIIRLKYKNMKEFKIYMEK